MTLSAEQIDLRRTGIGSSEIAAVCGLDPWKNAHTVFGEKRRLFDGPEETLAMRIGTLAEDLVAKLYTDETGDELDHGVTLCHPEHEWIIATPDRLVRGRRRLVEVKWAGWRVADRWGQDEDAVPPYVRAQVEWQMGVLGYEEAHVAAVIGGDEFRIYQIKRCVPLWDKLVEIGERFWCDNVLAGVAPPVDGTEGSRSVLEALFREHRPPLRPAPPEADPWVTQLLAAKAQIASGEDQKALAENQLRNIIGEADGIYGPWGKVRWMRSKGDQRRTLRFYPPPKKAPPIDVRAGQATEEGSTT